MTNLPRIKRIEPKRKRSKIILITTAEAALKYGIKESDLLEAIKDKRLVYKCIGNIFYVSAEAVRLYLMS